MKERNAFFSNVGLYMKLALVTLLMIGGGNFAWGERSTTIGGTGSTSSYFPFHGLYANTALTGSQYIIPKANLTKVQGESISKIKLYFTNKNLSWGDASFKVYLKEVSKTTFNDADFDDWETLTPVYSGPLSIDSNGEMLISFTTPFSYLNDNLLIGINMQSTGSSNNLSCYCQSSSYGASVYSNYNSYSKTVIKSKASLLPKTTIYFSGIAEPTSFEATETYYNRATLGWTAGETETEWQIKYNAGTDFNPDNAGTMVDADPVNSNPYTITGLSQNTQYYAYIRAYIDAEHQSEWVGTNFKTLEQFPLPTNFTLSNYTPTTATFTWTNGEGTIPTSWQLRYSTSSTFNPANDEGILIDNVSNPYTLEGLKEETTYYASIRAYYGSTNYSRWTDKIPVTPSDVRNLLINNGTTTNANMPQLYYTKKGEVQSQFIIPSSNIESIQNRQITTLTFYASSASKSWTGVTFEVYLSETSNTTYSSAAFESWGTKVYSGALSVADSKMTINFTTPFNYTDKNLMVGIKQVSGTTTSDSSPSWYGENIGTSSNYINIYSYSGIYNGTPMRGNFSPKLTITTQSTDIPITLGSNGYTTFASLRPLDLTSENLPSGLKAYKASISGTTVYFTEVNSTVQANTGVLLEGTASETYNIPVAISGSDISGSNAFEVNSTGDTFTGDANTTYFGLIKDSWPLVFGTFDPSAVAIPTNKAYLKVATAGARQLTCVFGDDGQTTGISDASHLTDNGKMRNDNFFNLNGQRIVKPTKGLYIKNGKKIVVK